MSKIETATEIIREKVYQLTHKEIPYSVQQENLAWTLLKDGSLRIDQFIFVERNSQKVHYFIYFYNNSFRKF